jgi:hypothetical protein
MSLPSVMWLPLAVEAAVELLVMAALMDAGGSRDMEFGVFGRFR